MQKSYYQTEKYLKRILINMSLWFNKPPRTDLNNFCSLKHIEEVLNWFKKNDETIQDINNKSAHDWFNQEFGIRYYNAGLYDGIWSKIPPEKKNIYEWIILNINLFTNGTSIHAENEKITLKESFTKGLDGLGKKDLNLLIRYGELIKKYNLTTNNISWEQEVKDIEAKENEDPIAIMDSTEFKIITVSSAVSGAVIRILAWFYKELFDENYEFPERRTPINI
jgi:hypothetical protein